MQWLVIEQLGIIQIDRIIAVGYIDSAPIRRLLDLTPIAHIIILTGGQRRQSAIILDSGHIILTAWSVTKLMTELKQAANHHSIININHGP